MAYELTGKVKLIQELKTFDSGFRKREIVVTVEDGRYPQDISLEFVQDKVDLVEGVSEGEDVTVTFDIRGREYNGRYFNNLQAWRINSNDSTAAADKEVQQGKPEPFDRIVDDGDVPF